MVQKDTIRLHITKHALGRGKERMGLGKKALERTARIAFLHGICVNEINGKLNQYMIEKQSLMNSVTTIRVYGEFIYLFDEHKLVTVYGLPNELKEHVKLIKPWES